MSEPIITFDYAAVPGGWEWVIIALVVLLLFGAKRIPELARGLGAFSVAFRALSISFACECIESTIRDVDSDGVVGGVVVICVKPTSFCDRDFLISG